MLTDPVVLTFTSAGAKTFTKIQVDSTAATYADVANDDRTLRISHQTTKNRHRRMIRLNDNPIVEDPISGATKRVSCSVYLVVDEPVGGAITDANLTDMVSAIADFSTQETGATFASWLKGGF